MRISTIINIVAILVMLYVFFPVSNIYIKTTALTGVNVLTQSFVMYGLIFLIALKNYRIFGSKPLLLCYVFYIIYFVFRLSGYYDTANQWFGRYHFSIFLSVLIYTYYIEKKDYHSLGLVSFCAVVFVVASAILNVVQLTRFPAAARGMSTEVEYFTIIGVARYGIITGLSFTIPIIVAQYKLLKQKGIVNISIVIVTLVCLYSTYLSALSAPILISILGVLFAIFGSRKLKQSSVALGIFVFLIVITPRTIMSHLFYLASINTGQKDISMKFNDIGLSIEEGIDVSQPANSIEYRAERIPQLVKKFLINPAFGTGYEENAHIFWLNYLAQFGLLGTYPLVLILYSQVKANLKIFAVEYHYYYLLAISLFIVLGFMKAYSADMMYFAFFLLPGSYYIKFLNIAPIDEVIHENVKLL